jgi:hypothetical protein
MTASTLSPRFRRAALRFGIAGLVATVAMGLLHTSAAKPLLLGLSGRSSGSCPFGGERAVPLTPAQVETRRAAMLAPERGAARAASRPALGFTLEGTTRVEVDAWIAQNHLECHVDRHGAGLECTDVPSHALPDPGPLAGLSRVLLGFDAGGRLVSLNVNSVFADAESAARVAAGLAAKLDQAAGPPSVRSGEATATFLTSSGLAQASAEWRFHDYHAHFSATNMGRRFLVDVVFQTVADAG